QEIKALDGEIAKLDAAQEQLQKRVEQHRAVLARKDEIATRHRELQALRREHEQIGLMLAQRQGLLNRRQTLEIEIQRQRNIVEGQVQSVRERIKQLDMIVGGRTGFEREQSRPCTEI